MTGTAMTEAGEFWKIYELDVIAIPTNRPLQRLNHPDVIYRTEKEKYDAIADEIERMHKWDVARLDERRRVLSGTIVQRGRRDDRVPAARAARSARRSRATEISEIERRGRPILVGTVSIEQSELISGLLDQRGIKHEVLNAKHHQREAEIVAQAGRKGAVTIATNMAGRGTDIVLGGNPEAMAWAQLQEKYATRLDVPPRGMGRAGRRDRTARADEGRGPRGGRAWAACTSSAPNGTRPGASTCSCAAVAAARATRAAAASSSRSKTT